MTGRIEGASAPYGAGPEGRREAPRPEGPVRVAALYRFTPFDDPEAVREQVRHWCDHHHICGTLLLAREGINGTVSGLPQDIAALIADLRRLPGCADLDVKYSWAPKHPFGRMKVKRKREIVTMGVADIDPVHHAGLYVEPQDWNALISDPDTILIDTRNDYEVEIGSFAGAIDPDLHRFRDFPAWLEARRTQWRQEGRADPKVAMFCTGGIRCEKSTAYARSLGLEQVYHLKGGILRYLEEVPEADSLWNGRCFVFDERVSVGHGLEPGDDRLCRSCGRPYAAGTDHRCPDE